MELDDLISACKKNQRLAQKKLVGRIAPGLKGLCQRYLNTDFEVEEALPGGDCISTQEAD